MDKIEKEAEKKLSIKRRNSFPGSAYFEELKFNQESVLEPQNLTFRKACSPKETYIGIKVIKCHFNQTFSIPSFTGVDKMPLEVWDKIVYKTKKGRIVHAYNWVPEKKNASINHSKKHSDYIWNQSCMNRSTTKTLFVSLQISWRSWYLLDESWVDGMKRCYNWLQETK